MFAEQKRKELKKANPKMRVQEMMDIIKAEWEEMGEQGKQKCEESAQGIKQRMKQPRRYGWV